MSTPTPHTEATEALERHIRELGPWFHNLRLQGIRTAPDHFLGNYPEVKFDSFRHLIPENLTGMSVLDIGCNAGFYSMEMKRRGADRVLGIDVDPHYLRQAKFAAEMNGMDIEYRELPVWDLATLGERFDLVIFMGVLYHLRHPLLALDLIHEHVARDLLLFQTLQRGSRQIEPVASDYAFFDDAPFDQPGFPKLHFIEQRYSGDPTNWWIPNRACSEAMLRSAGFSIEAQADDEVHLCRWQLSANQADEARCVYPARAAQ